MALQKNLILKMFFIIPIWKNNNSKTNLIQPLDFLKWFIIMNFSEFPYEHFKLVLFASMTEKTGTALPVGPWPYMGLACSNSAKTGKTANCPGRFWTKLLFTSVSRATTDLAFDTLEVTATDRGSKLCKTGFYSRDFS